jgi:serine protease 16
MIYNKLGMMAGFFRLKYPHFAHGAVSSSAPVKAQVDFRGYMDVVGTSLEVKLVGGSTLCREVYTYIFIYI